MTDVTDLLDRYGIPYQTGGSHRHVTVGWVGIDCPFCSPASGKFKLGINLAWGGTNCWSCSSHSLAEVLRELTGEPWGVCIELANGVRKSSLPKDLRPTGRLELPKGLGPLLPAHRRYLAGRKGGGLDPDEMEKIWGVKGIGLAAKLAWRIFLPITFRGETVSWTTRSISDDGVRYVGANPQQEKIKAKSVLFGLDFCRHACIVVEGPLDSIRLGPGAIATLGTTYTKSQILLLSKVPRRTICFDARDSEAQRRAGQLCDALSCYSGRTERVVLDAPDPGSASQREINLIRRSFLR